MPPWCCSATSAQAVLSPRCSDGFGCLEPLLRVGHSLLRSQTLGLSSLVGAVGVVDVQLADQVAR
jgi:hypothetical protein